MYVGRCRLHEICCNLICNRLPLSSKLPPAMVGLLCGKSKQILNVKVQKRCLVIILCNCLK